MATMGFDFSKNPRWRTAAIWKIVLPRYLRHGSTDFDKTWHEDANGALDSRT